MCVVTGKKWVIYRVEKIVLQSRFGPSIGVVSNTIQNLILLMMDNMSFEEGVCAGLSFRRFEGVASNLLVCFHLRLAWSTPRLRC